MDFVEQKIKLIQCTNQINIKMRKMLGNTERRPRHNNQHRNCMYM